jgi:hypothetical protein
MRSCVSWYLRRPERSGCANTRASAHVSQGARSGRGAGEARAKRGRGDETPGGAGRRAAPDDPAQELVRADGVVHAEQVREADALDEHGEPLAVDAGEAPREVAAQRLGLPVEGRVEEAPRLHLVAPAHDLLEHGQRLVDVELARAQYARQRVVARPVGIVSVHARERGRAARPQRRERRGLRLGQRHVGDEGDGRRRADGRRDRAVRRGGRGEGHWAPGTPGRKEVRERAVA